ncbi:Zeta-sarcoglycan [Trichinella spiralis]|uniref:Zeta-sarcoglycan n=2 Tax=Trichinella spiralis TaxID=6334 RepID=A0ABR3KXF8_TRISP
MIDRSGMCGHAVESHSMASALEQQCLSSAVYSVLFRPLLERFEMRDPTALRSFRSALVQAEREQEGFLCLLIKHLLSKSQLDVSLHESLLRLQGTACSDDLKLTNGGAVVQEVGQRATVLRAILARIPNEIGDRRTFLETIKEIANSIKKLLDAINSLIPLLSPELQPLVDQRKRDFVKFSKRFSNTLKEYFKGEPPESIGFWIDICVVEMANLSHDYASNSLGCRFGDKLTTYNHGSSKMTDSTIYRIGIYGWRKRCLYAMILLLIVLIVANITVTFWIMSIMGFTLDGIGGMRISKAKIEVTGEAEFVNAVYLQRLSSASKVPMFIESDRAVLLTARDKTGNISSRLVLKDNQIQAICDRFEVVNRDGKAVFSATENEVAVRVENLRIISEGGSVFDGSIQTSVIRPEADMPLLLESPTRGMEVRVAQDIEILSRAGDIKAEALHNIVFQSANGEIVLNSPNIYVDRLMRGTEKGHMQYQVCLCENGRLFLAHNGVDCRASSDVCGFR